MEFKLLVKNTSFLAGTRFVQFFVGIIRSKINAIYLGTEGVGIVSQFLMIMKSFSGFTTLGMNEAVVKQIAENSDSDESNRIIASSIKTYIITVSVFISISSSLLFFFRDDITLYVFGSNKYLSFFYLALITFPFLIINSVFFAILKGFKGIKYIARARIRIIVSNLFLFIPLVLIFKLKGAIIYLPISFLVTLIWNFHFANKYYLKPNKISYNSIINAPVKSSFRNEMLSFSGYGLIVGTMAILSVFIGRSIVIDSIGISALGIYSPIVAWAGLFTGFLLPTFNIYLFPRFSEIKQNKEVIGIVNDAMRLATLGLLPLLFLAIPYRYIMINIFYSMDFIDAANYLPYHFIGVSFNVWFVVFSQVMTPRGYIKQHSLFTIIFYALNIGLAFYLVPKFGLNGWMLRSVLSNIFLFVIYFLFLKIKIDLKISRSNVILMTYLLVVSFILIFMEKFNYSKSFGMLMGPVFLFASFFLLRRKERIYILNKISFIKGFIK